MIVIIDYGLGNLASIANMLKKIGAPAEISNDVSKISQADKLILPGVGHFAKGMENLQQSGLIDTVNREVLEHKKPVLGICLGMQLMTNHSEEGDCKGLGWIDAETTRFRMPENSSLKIPHMGWSDVHFVQQQPLLNGISPEPRYYFVHSYHVTCKDPANVLGTCDYGYTFDCAIVKDNIMGVQFHPEKSHRYGMELLNNFANL